MSGHSHPVVHPSTHGHLHVPGSTPIHRLGPSAKLVGVFCFVAVVALTPSRPPSALAIDVIVVIAVVGAARIRPAAIWSRAVVVMPFLIFAALVPLIGGGPKVHLGPVPLSIAGLSSGWGIAAKAICGVGATVALTATTPVMDIIDGLNRLHLPRLIVAIIAFMFRYLDLLADRITRMRQSMVARCYDPRWLWQTKPIAQSAGALFVRSYEQGERIHLAMLARGYDGTMPDLGTPRSSSIDYLRALVPAVIAAGAWTVTR